MSCCLKCKHIFCCFRRKNKKVNEKSIQKLSTEHQLECLVDENTSSGNIQSILDEKLDVIKDLQQELNNANNDLLKEKENYEKHLSSLEEKYLLKIRDLTEHNNTAIEELEKKYRDVKEEVELLKLNQEEVVHETIQDQKNEIESLQNVLDMKNTEVQELKQMMANNQFQMNNVRTLTDINITQSQKIEDLRSQLHGKSVENRTLYLENLKMHQALDKHRHLSTNQEQKIEELTYRLKCNTPSPTTPFNPVFTPSP